MPVTRLADASGRAAPHDPQRGATVGGLPREEIEMRLAVLCAPLLLATAVACVGCGGEDAEPATPPPAAVAEATPSPARSASRQGRLDRFAERFALTPEQVDAIDAIWNDKRDATQALQARVRAEGKRMRSAKEELLAIRKEADERVLALLSEEQAEAYRTFRRERREYNESSMRRAADSRKRREQRRAAAEAARASAAKPAEAAPPGGPAPEAPAAP